ncbi:hypothetical protein [Nonomuraea aridisoli]|uniref:hypothetical protein n=1 Tax=Nonomuraea aridisoli TaxID=2070368 RepID=UPI0011B943B4|nr:hypothetical protein [Nonomuraea aridisoli]
MEPGAFRTRAYAGFAGQSIDERVPDYWPMLAAVRDGMIAEDGEQPGDPERGVRAVIAAIDQDDPPQRLVLGSAGYDRVLHRLEAVLAELRGQEAVARAADFPAA